MIVKKNFSHCSYNIVWRRKRSSTRTKLVPNLILNIIYILHVYHNRFQYSPPPPHFDTLLTPTETPQPLLDNSLPCYHILDNSYYLRWFKNSIVLSGFFDKLQTVFTLSCPSRASSMVDTTSSTMTTEEVDIMHPNVWRMLDAKGLSMISSRELSLLNLSTLVSGKSLYSSLRTLVCNNIAV